VHGNRQAPTRQPGFHAQVPAGRNPWPMGNRGVVSSKSRRRRQKFRRAGPPFWRTPRWIVWEDRIASRCGWPATSIRAARRKRLSSLATVVGPEGMTGETEYRELLLATGLRAIRPISKRGGSAIDIGCRSGNAGPAGSRRVTRSFGSIQGMAFGTGNTNPAAML